ncbi:MAG: cytochrome c family protein [Thermodesulfobacterium geofontis]|uniref:Cytochrome c family protein n=1 Tax=Thermodesulfobacterium geofontis TaxID=1295609 RepID=A0A2N7Q8L4_9BACT|nr:MAG: cytochrome c family protein [Thermodesulfobacterium geofontis]
MKLSHRLFYILGALVFLSVFVCLYIFSGNLTFAKSENSCLKCHSVKRLPKMLSSGEAMDLYIDKEKFLNSVHGSLSCTDCHADIDLATHPRPLKIASKLEYTKKVSQNCANCHPEDGLSPIHKNILKEGKISCAECHGSHYIKPIKELTKDGEKCLECHTVKRLPKVLPNGEEMYLYVEKEKFLNSIHGKLGCLFCHKDIDPATHPRPVQIFSKQEYAKKVYKNCLNCHPFNSLSPIHKEFLKEDRMVCFGCHGNHYVKSRAQWLKETDKCLKCHFVRRLPKVLPSGEEMDLYVDKEAFKKTVHGDVGCWVCHQGIDFSNHPRPMRIESKRAYAEKVSAGCYRCHPKDVLSRHKGHAKIIEMKDFLCIDCHGYHKNQSIKEWKEKVKYEDYCMSCHKLDLYKKLSSGEKISVKVDVAQIKASVHKNFECIVCHKGFSKKEHPSYDFKNKKEYAINLSKNICQICHTDEELKKNPAHYAIAKTASCIDCHGYHNVKSLKVPAGVPENKYCMNCHSMSLVKKMENGEILSVKVDEREILTSAHKDLKCSQCHIGFSTRTHPIRSFKSLAEYRSKAQEICANCHKKESFEYNESIHAKAILKGNKEAPDCLKCHGYHNTPKITSDLKLRYQTCMRCHDKEDKSLKESIHYKALEEGKKDAPVCSSCHNAHKVLPTNIAQINNNCIVCHDKNLKKIHNKWLYNPPFKLESFVDVHFSSVSCEVCHTKGEKAIRLILASGKNAVTLEEISKVIGREPAEMKTLLDYNNDGIIQKDELWKFMNMLKEKTKVELMGKLVMVNSDDAHKIVSKKESVKDCAFCHNPEAIFKGRLEINKLGEKPEKFELERSAVNSAYTIPNIKDFYVLGLTKINILDTLFIIALIAGAGVAIGHVFLRIITIPIRRRRGG